MSTVSDNAVAPGSNPAQLKFKAQTINQLMKPFVGFMENPEITELRIRPGQVVTIAFGEKRYESVPEADHAYLRSLATALIAYAGLPVRGTNYVRLPGGERGTVLMNPVTMDDALLIVIRKHSLTVKNIDQLAEEGAFADWANVSFNKPTPEQVAEEAARTDFRRLDAADVELLALLHAGKVKDFLRRAVQLKRNIVVSGKTGSGKTTLVRSACEEVPKDEHIATIEDVHELMLPNHSEVTNLFYGEGGGRVSALECVAACMRITPDRIFLAELRGGEAWVYVNALNTDHGGGITTTHANGAVESFDRIATLIKNSEVGSTLSMEAIKHVLYTTIDIVLYMRNRKVVQVFFDPIFKRQQMS
ncbi:type IV secretion system protein VirB11 [Burkholderia latens]|uniref:ATPase, T2SS/T4P/T4SS family n=1 Tax=Burkholderia latens TaxID=488446 RepID=UPI0039A4F13D